MDRLKPRFQNKEKFVSWDKFNYLLFNSSLSQQINDRYENPIAVDISADENERIIRFMFRRSGDYCISNNGTGAGRKVSFTQGKRLKGFEHKRYYNLDFKRDYMDLRY